MFLKIKIYPMWRNNLKRQHRNFDFSDDVAMQSTNAGGHNLIAVKRNLPPHYMLGLIRGNIGYNHGVAQQSGPNRSMFTSHVQWLF